MRVIDPIKEDDVSWNVLQQFRVMQNHITENHQGLSLLGCQLPQPEQMSQVYFTLALSLHHGITLASAQVVGFIRIDVQHGGTEIGQKLCIHPIQQRVRLFNSGRERPVQVALAQVPVAFGGEKAIAVPEGLQVRLQLDVVFLAPLVKLPDFLCGNRIGALMHIFKKREGKGVLDVKLQHIDPQHGKLRYQLFQIVQRIYPAPTDIEHEAAVFKNRPIDYLHVQEGPVLVCLTG